jgi:hypothetical protein
MDISRKLYDKCRELVCEPARIQISNSLTDEIKALSGQGYEMLIPRTRRSAPLKKRFQLATGEATLLQDFILSETGLDIFHDDYPTGDRVENPAQHNNEKYGANASQDVILLNNAAGRLKLNHEISDLFHSISCAGMEVRHKMIESIEHDALIICENFPPMYYLHQLKDNPLFSNALVVYRGDSQTGKRANEVCKFVSYCSQSLPIYYFGDLDPEGLRIAKDDFKVNGIILPSLAELISLDSNQLKTLATPDKYFPQLTEHSPVNPLMYPASWRAHITLMNQHQLGWQQEPLLKAKIEWTLLLCE